MQEHGIKYVELPVAFDALTVVINPKNDWIRSTTMEELKKMWEPAAQGKVMKWSDVNPEWPNHKISMFGPGADSGTFDYFTDAINGKEKASRATLPRARTTMCWCRAWRMTSTPSAILAWPITWKTRTS